jgi:hypothetical protein
LALATPTVEPGTNCLTKAEDAVRDAIGRSLAWRTLAAPYGADPLTEEEGLARVLIDGEPDPDNGCFFPLAEVERRGTLCCVTCDPENGFAIVPGPAAGAPFASARILAVIETFHPRREANQNVLLTRRVKNAVPTVADQARAALEASKGRRWMGPVTLVQPPLPLLEVADEEVVGTRMQSTLLFEVGPGEGRE